MEILITFAEKTRSAEYPLCVKINGGQEHLVRDMRDARLFANGASVGMGAHVKRVDHPDYPIIKVDPRLVLPA